MWEFWVKWEKRVNRFASKKQATYSSDLEKENSFGGWYVEVKRAECVKLFWCYL